VEAEGVRRARQALQTADIVLWVVDATTRPDLPAEPSFLAELPDGCQCLRVVNKIDLLAEGEQAPGLHDEDADTVWISARNGAGLERLRRRIRALAGAGGAAEGAGSFSARQRHVDALRRAGTHIDAGRTVMQAQAAGELLAEELRLAQQALAELTGEMLPDDLLGEIFASFCIGK
jgi:tRNA modification GTPase